MLQTGGCGTNKAAFNSLFQSESCLNRVRPGLQLSGRGLAQCVSQAHKLGKEKRLKIGEKIRVTHRREAAINTNYNLDSTCSNCKNAQQCCMKQFSQLKSKITRGRKIAKIADFDKDTNKL